MADVFDRNIDYQGAIKPDETYIGFSGGAGVAAAGAILRDVDIRYRQQISRIWSLFGTSAGQRLYFVAGPTEGELQIGTMLGGAEITGSICQPTQVTIDYHEGLCMKGQSSATTTMREGSVELKNLIVNNVSLRATAEDMIVNRGIGGMFTSMTSNGAGSLA